MHISCKQQSTSFKVLNCSKKGTFGFIRVPARQGNMENRENEQFDRENRENRPSRLIKTGKMESEKYFSFIFQI